MAEFKVILKNRGNFNIYWESGSKLLCLSGAQNRSKLTERMKAVDLPFLYPGYLLRQASPECKPGVSEHAPAMLFMSIFWEGSCMVKFMLKFIVKFIIESVFEPCRWLNWFSGSDDVKVLNPYWGLDHSDETLIWSKPRKTLDKFGAHTLDPVKI